MVASMAERGREARADGHLDVLGSIPPTYRKAVLEQCKRRVLAKGELIWSQGEPAEYVAFIVSGKVMSWFQARNGKTGTTGFWCAGDLLGAADVGTVSTRQQTVRCVEGCVIYTLSFARFDELVRRFPELGLTVIRALSIRLRWVAQLAVTLETQPAFERICTVLLALSERFGTDSDEGVLINLKLTNEDLAAFAGVTRQFTNATLHDLRKRGLLITRTRSLILTDREAIEKLAYRQ
jgi:CRP-like cAMP-binding protein